MGLEDKNNNNNNNNNSSVMFCHTISLLVALCLFIYLFTFMVNKVD